MKLKPGKTEQFLSWANSLSERQEEVKESLMAEGMVAELLLLDQREDGDYIILYTKAKNLLEANLAFEQSRLKLDLETKKIISTTWDISSSSVVQKIIEVIA